MVTFAYSDGSKGSMSYPKWLMEQHLGRKMLPNETVDHIDRDFRNDEISNLRVIDKSRHSSDDAPRVKPNIISCVWCEAEVDKISSKRRSNAKQGKAGPFCSKRCSGSYGASLQNGYVDKFPVQNSPESEYYYIEK